MAKTMEQGKQPDFAAINELVTTGRMDDAIKAAESQLEKIPGSKKLIQLLSGLHFSKGDLEAARGYMVMFHELEPKNLQCLQGLAAIEQQLGRPEAAIEALVKAVKAAPDNAFSFLHLAHAYKISGDNEKAVLAAFLAYDRHVKIFNMRDDSRVPANIKKLAGEGEKLVREKLADIHGKAIEQVSSKHPKADLSRINNLVWRDVFADPVKYQHDQQRPQWLYIPGLDPRPVFERKEFDWVKGLESAFPEILEEAQNVLEPDKDTTPYIDTGQEVQEGWKKLDGSMQWGVAHLFKEGRRNPRAYKKFPKTAAALDAILATQKSETLMEAFFSVLRPGAEIPPHFGQTNAGLTVHFPLIIPDHAGIRVANHRHIWRPGETFIFDDSFEHKAWNRSDQTRIILILGDWHPDLTLDERAALDHCIPARLNWMGEATLEALIDS